MISIFVIDLHNGNVFASYIFQDLENMNTSIRTIISIQFNIRVNLDIHLCIRIISTVLTLITCYYVLSCLILCDVCKPLE